MDYIDQLLRRYFNLTPDEQDKFRQDAGLSVIPGHVPPERIFARAVRLQWSKNKRTSTPSQKLTIRFNSMSMEEREQFLKELDA